MTPEQKQAPGDVLVRDDVDDVVGHAEDIRREDEQKLSLDELKAVGRELDLKEEHIERAVERLTDERSVARERAQQELEQRTRLLARVKVGAAAVLAVALISGLVAWIGASSKSSSLRALSADADRARAQLVNVSERQQRIEAEFRPRPPSPDRDAELLGAENRVRVERKRYDDAAAKYNSAVTGAFGGLAVTWYGLPARVPLSDELR